MAALPCTRPARLTGGALSRSFCSTGRTCAYCISCCLDIFATTFMNLFTQHYMLISVRAPRAYEFSVGVFPRTGRTAVVCCWALSQHVCVQLMSTCRLNSLPLMAFPQHVRTIMLLASEHVSLWLSPSGTRPGASVHHLLVPSSLPVFLFLGSVFSSLFILQRLVYLRLAPRRS